MGGAYYRSVIEPAERALLRKQAEVDGREEVVVLLHDDMVDTLCPGDWCTVIPMTYGTILKQEAELVKAWSCQAQNHQAFLAGDRSARRIPMLDKELLARFCLLSAESVADGVDESEVSPHSSLDGGVLFLDDRLEYIN